MLGFQADMTRRRIESQWFEAVMPRVHFKEPTMMDCPFMSRTSIPFSNDQMTSSASMAALSPEVGPEVGPAVYPLTALLSRPLMNMTSNAFRSITLQASPDCSSLHCFYVLVHTSDRGSSFRHWVYVFVSSELVFILFGVKAFFGLSSCIPASRFPQVTNTAYQKDGLDI